MCESRNTVCKYCTLKTLSWHSCEEFDKYKNGNADLNIDPSNFEWVQKHGAEQMKMRHEFIIIACPSCKSPKAEPNRKVVITAITKTASTYAGKFIIKTRGTTAKPIQWIKRYHSRKSHMADTETELDTALTGHDLNPRNSDDDDDDSTQRSGSEPPSTRNAIPHGHSDDNMHRNPGIFRVPDPSEVAGRFMQCQEKGCKVTSGAAEFPAMTLRTGFSYCLDHIRDEEVTHRSEERTDFSNMTLIFYNLELNKDGEIEQIGACTENNKTFSSFIKTSVRANTSPMLRAIPQTFWTIFAAHPARAIKDFIAWIDLNHQTNTGGDKNQKNIMLAAHNGSSHDHIRLIRMMMKHGVDPPDYRLTDTLVLFKVIKGRNLGASLAALRDRYAPWIPHIAHDADSDASVLRYVTVIAFKDTKPRCYPFGISCGEYTNRTGMNMYLPSPVATFPDTFSSPTRLVGLPSQDSDSVSVSYETDYSEFEF
ncbi:Ribonuclease H-like protein, partial [Metarhizium majus ARSEF 297]